MPETIEKPSPEHKERSNKDQLRAVVQNKIEALEYVQGTLAGAIDTALEDMRLFSQQADSEIGELKFWDSLHVEDLMNSPDDEICDGLLESSQGKSELYNLQSNLAYIGRKIIEASEEVGEAMARHVVNDNLARIICKTIQDSRCEEETDWDL